MHEPASHQASGGLVGAKHPLTHWQRTNPLELDDSELLFTQILIGPEDPERQQAIVSLVAPRLDYHLVADRCHGQLKQWHPPPAGLRGPRPVRMGRSFLGNLAEAVRLTGALRAGSVVYATGETWGLPVALVGAFTLRRRFAHIMYVHRVFSPAWLRFLRLTRRWLAVDGWICVNRRQAELLSAALGAGGNPIAVVSQGVDTSFFDPDKAQPPQGRLYILAVGAEMRNYALLFEAARGLDVEVVVKASSAWMNAGRGKLAAIPPNVRLITQRLSYVELRDLYAGATLVVTPLYDTPQAAGITTILEAMAMGKSVVTTQSRGLPDGLVSSENCIITEPDTSELARAIAELLKDPARRKILAANGRRFVLEACTLEHYAQKISDFMDAVAANR